MHPIQIIERPFQRIFINYLTGVVLKTYRGHIKYLPTYSCYSGPHFDIRSKLTQEGKSKSDRWVMGGGGGDGQQTMTS